MKKVRVLVSLLLAVLMLCTTIAVSGCQSAPAEKPVQPDPFNLSFSQSGKDYLVILSGDSAGHKAGETSEFKLRLNNYSSEPWEGEYLIQLLDENSIVMEIARKDFSVPTGLEPETVIPVTFDSGLDGPYGLSLYVDTLKSQAVQTIWIGEKDTASAGPWPSIGDHPSLWPEYSDSRDESAIDESIQELAEQFITNSSTFAFDGIPGSLKLVKTAAYSAKTISETAGNTTGSKETKGYELTYEFDCRHAGYGDRTGRNVLQVLTHHSAVIKIENDKVVSAIIDGKWDMLAQKLLGSEGVSKKFDFSNEEDTSGWSSDFVDLPVDYEDSSFNLQSSYAPLPDPLATGPRSAGLLISGNNASDDLFMYIKKQLTGLEPNTDYLANIQVEFVTQAPAGAVGIGGSPGESVWMKVGASTAEPVPVEESAGGVPYYRLNADKGTQQNNGENAVIVGNVAKTQSTDFDTFELKTLDNSDNPLRVKTDKDGNLWIFAGTDSGFEGTTTIYYTKIIVTLTLTTS